MKQTIVLTAEEIKTLKQLVETELDHAATDDLPASAYIEHLEKILHKLEHYGKEPFL